jgi:hypothetical protein
MAHKRLIIKIIDEYLLSHKKLKEKKEGQNQRETK